MPFPPATDAKNLQPLAVAARSETLALKGQDGRSSAQVSLFDQGAIQILQAAVTGLAPKMPFVLALSSDRAGRDKPEPLAAFMTNPAGAAIVNTVGPIRQVTRAEAGPARRYLVILSGTPAALGPIVQVQSE